MVSGIALAALASCIALGPMASASQHRSRAVMREFQRASLPLDGRTTGRCPGYIKDHVIPLACGGPDTVANLEWQTFADARAKDRRERETCAR
jgi:hypothetical protein